MMKKLIILTTIVVFFIGCNIKPSKEARIQKLETELQQTLEAVDELNQRVAELEAEQKQLKIKIDHLQIDNE